MLKYIVTELSKYDMVSQQFQHSLSEIVDDPYMKAILEGMKSDRQAFKEMGGVIEEVSYDASEIGMVGATATDSHPE